MQQEVRNLFPTVANTGVISHHHAPPAASWDAAADAVVAAKEADLEARRRWGLLMMGLQQTMVVVCWIGLCH
jgi:hypothetical protein